MKILITGGGGFIGSYILAMLRGSGHEITILDLFHEQIHGLSPDLNASWLNGVHVIRGSVEDVVTFESAAADCDVVIHLAAETGTGQSMQEVIRYSSVNLIGTTNLAHLMMNGRLPKLRRIIVASSRAIYGEGKYHCHEHGAVYPSPRNKERMDAGLFEPLCPRCQREVAPRATDELSLKCPASFYGLTKQFQEESLLLMAKAANVSCLALRFQNVYGPRQSLKNPYTGVLTVFARQAFNGREINVFEDGLETRDFVYVEDVARAVMASLLLDSGFSGSYNIGSGVSTTMHDIALLINDAFGGNSRLNISGQFRVGDIRHNFADISNAARDLSYAPKVSIEEGVRNFCSWAKFELKRESYK